MEKTNQILAQLDLQKKLSVLKYVEEWKSVNKTLKLFEVPKSTYYKWKKAYDSNGENGLLRKHPVAYNHPKKISEPVINKILDLRKEHQLGSWRINLSAFKLDFESDLSLYLAFKFEVINVSLSNSIKEKFYCFKKICFSTIILSYKNI